jgi:fucose 4-O-acetylase-like acetyltransferase
MKERVSWLDYGKCICMLMVIYSHTVIYSTDRINDFLLLMLPTRLLVFFFISGYLTKVEGFDFKKTITSIGKKLLFPYFLFTLIIYLPKHLAHGTDISLQNMLYEIFGGFASWFVAALAVSKITLAVCLKYTKNLLTIGAVCLGLAVVGFLITEYAAFPVPWYAHYGLISLIYLYSGMLYKKYEAILSKRPLWQALLALLLYAVCVGYDYYVTKTSTFFYKMQAGDVTLLGVSAFLLLSFLGIWMMVSLVKLLPSNIKWMLYIGKNSLTYYYLNTGLLLVLIAGLRYVGFPYLGTNWFTIPLFLLVVGVLTVISNLILRFAPWMVGNFGNKK